MGNSNKRYHELSIAICKNDISSLALLFNHFESLNFTFNLADSVRKEYGILYD